VFHAATRLVQLNVIVRDKNGPVANLAKSDVILTDRGTPSTISVFSVESALGRARGAQPLPPNAFSNRQGASNSVTIVLLDSLNTLDYSKEVWELFPTRFENQALGYAKQQLVKFVNDLDPRDRVAIYSLGHRLSVLCDFTSDPEELRRTLAGYRAVALTSSELVEPNASALPRMPGPEFNAAVDGGNQKAAGMANASRAGITVGALLAIAAHADGIPGRKNLVWLTASLPFSGPAAAGVLSRANIAVYPVDARGLATSFDPHYRPPGQDAMQALADETGGRAYLNNNDLAGAIRKAVDHAAVTYTLGFYPDADSLDGKPHDLKVRVGRPGLDMRYARTYVAARDVRTCGTRNLAWAIESPLESSAIGLLARVERGMGGPTLTSLRVLGSVDLHNLQLTQNSDARSGAVDIRIFQQDAAGKAIAETHDRLNLQLTNESYAAYLKTGVLFREYVEPKDGLATLRVLVSDTSNGAVGSLIVPASRIK
jgi:VWFA-related protein